MSKQATEERNRLFYTERGANALKTRMQNIADVYNKGEFPFSRPMFGFGTISIATKEEAMTRMKELADLTGASINIQESVAKGDDGSQTIKTKVEVTYE